MIYINEVFCNCNKEVGQKSLQKMLSILQKPQNTSAKGKTSVWIIEQHYWELAIVGIVNLDNNLDMQIRHEGLHAI